MKKRKKWHYTDDEKDTCLQNATETKHHLPWCQLGMCMWDDSNFSPLCKSVNDFESSMSIDFGAVSKFQ